MKNNICGIGCDDFCIFVGTAFFFNHQQWLDHGRAFGETRLPLQRFGVSHPRGSRAGGSLALGVFRQCEKRPLDRYSYQKKIRGYQICGCSIRAMPNYVSLPCLPALPCDLKLGDDILITLKLSDPRPEALLFLTRGSCNNWVTAQNHPKPLFLHENNDPPFWMMWGSPIFKTPESVQVHCCWCKK